MREIKINVFEIVSNYFQPLPQIEENKQDTHMLRYWLCGWANGCVVELMVEWLS